MAAVTQFVMSITTGNAAFGESDDARNTEVARILRQVATKVSQGETDGILRDLNGNIVGSFAFEARGHDY